MTRWCRGKATYKARQISITHWLLILMALEANWEGL